MSPDDIVTFCDQTARAIAYLSESEFIYLYDGTPVAWVAYGEYIYAYDGQYLGTFDDGWVWDR